MGATGSYDYRGSDRRDQAGCQTSRGIGVLKALRCAIEYLMKSDPSGFEDVRSAFALTLHESRKLMLCHAHSFGPVL